MHMHRCSSGVCERVQTRQQWIARDSLTRARTVYTRCLESQRQREHYHHARARARWRRYTLVPEGCWAAEEGAPLGLSGGISKLAVQPLPQRSLLVDSSSYRHWVYRSSERILSIVRNHRERPSPAGREERSEDRGRETTDVSWSTGRSRATYNQVRSGQVENEDGERTAGFPGDGRRRLGEDTDPQPLRAQWGLFLRRAATGKLSLTYGSKQEGYTRRKSSSSV